MGLLFDYDNNRILFDLDENMNVAENINQEPLLSQIEATKSPEQNAIINSSVINPIQDAAKNRSENPLILLAKPTPLEPLTVNKSRQIKKHRTTAFMDDTKIIADEIISKQISK